MSTVNILKTAREKQLLTHKKIPKRLTADFSPEIMKVKRKWNDIFKVLKPKKYVNQESDIQRTSLVVQWLRH